MRTPGLFWYQAMVKPYRNKNLRLRYNFQRKIGHIWLEGFYCMSDCIRTFEGIDPGVMAIMTYWEGGLDRIYQRQPDGKWQSYRGQAT